MLWYGDATQIDDFFSFDQILLDAPCSGSGTINLENTKLEETFTMKLLEKSVKTQKALLNKAIDLLKPRQEMIYSTCSILKNENEEILQKVMKEKNIEILPIELEGMEEISFLPTTIKGTICILPNELYEGFFVAKIRRK